MSIEIDKRFKNILSEMDSQDCILLRKIVDLAIDELKNEGSEEELKNKFEETLKRLREIEGRVLLNLKKRKNDAICSFCLSRFDSVEHMFKSEVNVNHICSSCVVGAYEILQKIKKV